jgi:hypothetical protein
VEIDGLHDLVCFETEGFDFRFFQLIFKDFDLGVNSVAIWERGRTREAEVSIREEKVRF